MAYIKKSELVANIAKLKLDIQALSDIVDKQAVVIEERNKMLQSYAEANKELSNKNDIIKGRKDSHFTRIDNLLVSFLDDLAHHQKNKDRDEKLWFATWRVQESITECRVATDD